MDGFYDDHPFPAQLQSFPMQPNHSQSSEDSQGSSLGSDNPYYAYYGHSGRLPDDHYLPPSASSGLTSSGLYPTYPAMFEYSPGFASQGSAGAISPVESVDDSGAFLEKHRGKVGKVKLVISCF